MPKLILMRHGQSVWNAANLFTGWVDIPLSTKGIEESIQAGHLIKELPIDLIFTSTLIRAQMTALLAMTVHQSGKVPVIMHSEDKEIEKSECIYSEETKKQIIPITTAWQLNERKYGELQGMNKAELTKLYGIEQIQTWRRSYHIPPPNGESLEMTAARTLPYFKKVIIPALDAGKNIFIVAHGNSLRSIMMELDDLNAQTVVHLELSTGSPIVYTYHPFSFRKDS